MPSLCDIPWKLGYGPQDDRLRDFFIPALVASVRYDRAAGYFSSTMLAVAAAGVTKLILNGGKMRLLCGADMSEADVEAINQGHVLLARRSDPYVSCELSWTQLSRFPCPTISGSTLSASSTVRPAS
jgi:hypothetical protein